MNHMKLCCDSILRTGFGTLPMSSSMKNSMESMVRDFSDIDEHTKKQYQFESETDGFLPFGSEYAKHVEQPDLCERFCYWHTHASVRREHEFSHSPFIQAARRYEEEMSPVAQQLMDLICSEFGVESVGDIRATSYLQLCVYGRDIPREGRKFAQDPHEDGHLLTFVKPNRDGLVLVRGSHLEPVRLLENELAVMSGSLLTVISDYAIPAAYHAVLTPPENVGRTSLVYFVNPRTDQPLRGFHRREHVDLSVPLNQRHTGFGNKTLQTAM